MTQAARGVAPGSSLPLKTKVSLASADYGVNLAYHAVELFLLFFYTDIAGLPPLMAGLILTLGSVWDAVCDPIVGALADRTRSRWGRFRPWVVSSGPVLGVSLALAFWKPGLEGATLAIYAVAAHLLFRTAYACATIPYIGLTARITHDSADRATISGLRMQFAGIASLTVAFGFPIIRDLFAPADAVTGFAVAAAALGALITPIFFLAMWGVKEPVETAAVEAAPIEKASFSLGSLVRTVVQDFRIYSQLLTTNSSLIRVLLGTMLVSTAGTLVYKTAIYYYKYYAMDAGLGSYALAMSATAQLLLAPLWAMLANKSSKRTGWYIASAVGIGGLGGLSLAPTGEPILALAFFFLFGAGNCGLSVMFWSMIPDTVEVNEYITGERNEAKTIGLALFVRKMTLAADALLVGIVLEASGFRPNVAQTETALDAIRGLIGYVPVACLLLTWVVMFRYRLNRQEHNRIRVEIAARNSESAPTINS